MLWGVNFSRWGSQIESLRENQRETCSIQHKKQLFQFPLTGSICTQKLIRCMNYPLTYFNKDNHAEFLIFSLSLKDC